MRKILIIDDKEVNSENIAVTADEIRNSLRSEISPLIVTSRKAELYFQWDDAGNRCEPLFETNDYDFVFIHHSQQSDSIFPSNIMDLIKDILGEKLVLFSGSTVENFCDNSEKYVNRSISRKKILDKLPEFLKKSVLLGEWKAELLFYVYEENLIRKIIMMQEQELDDDLIFISSEMEHFLKLKFINVGSSKYSDLLTKKDHNLIEELRKL